MKVAFPLLCNRDSRSRQDFHAAGNPRAVQEDIPQEDDARRTGMFFSTPGVGRQPHPSRRRLDLLEALELFLGRPCAGAANDSMSARFQFQRVTLCVYSFAVFVGLGDI